MLHLQNLWLAIFYRNRNLLSSLQWLSITFFYGKFIQLSTRIAKSYPTDHEVISYTNRSFMNDV